MLKRGARWTNDSPTNAQSDQELLVGIRHGEAAALNRLYDRYAGLVFTLACSAAPQCAELITEEVFLGLWKIDSGGFLPEPLPATVLRLTAEAVARYHQGNRPACAHWGQPVLPALAPFAHLPAGVFDVMILTCLGGLAVGDIATALGHDQPTILKKLAAGFAMVRGASMNVSATIGRPAAEELWTLSSRR